MFIFNDFLNDRSLNSMHLFGYFVMQYAKLQRFGRDVAKSDNHMTMC